MLSHLITEYQKGNFVILVTAEDIKATAVTDNLLFDVPISPKTNLVDNCISGLTRDVQKHFSIKLQGFVTRYVSYFST